MFNRIAYKRTAKSQLKGRWNFPVIMSLIVILITAALSVVENLFNDSTLHISHPHPGALNFNAGMGSIPFVVSVAASGIFGILIVAQFFVYIKISRTVEKATFNDFLAGLEKWLSGFLGILWYDLWTLLWALLFVIPGIVKAIAYSQMFFVLAEYPEAGVRRAMQISKTITAGYKGDLFVMGMSFIGWGILATIPCGIGWLWLAPYMNMSFTNAYYALKNQALASGKLAPADFTR